MRRPVTVLFCLVCALVLAGCPTDRGTRSALTPTSTLPPTAPPSTTPGSGAAPDPGRDPRVPDDVPPSVVLGGATLVALSTASGTTTEITRPDLGQGLLATGLLERAQGLVVSVRGPLPQDAGALWLLGDAAHEPRSLGTGTSVAAGATDHELWAAEVTGSDGLTLVRRLDVAQDVPALVQRLPRGRTLAGVAAGGLVLSVGPDEDGLVLGPVDLVDPVRGTIARHLADVGLVVAADGQRTVVLTDARCTDRCSVLVAGPAADRTVALPAGVVPEAGGVTSAASVVFVGRQRNGPRHVFVLSLTTGEVADTGLALPPEATPTPMAMDRQGAWAFLRSGASTVVAVRTEDATPVSLPWTVDPWMSIAVSNGGTCPCAQAGGGSASPTV